MRYLRIFLLHFQKIFEYRSRSFVWFLIACINPLLFLVFWIGKLKGSGQVFSGWELSSITSYYFMIAILATFLMSHTEDDVAREDIGQGNLINYLIKPFPYFWMKFFNEIPYRIIQGSCGVILCIMLLSFFPSLFTIANAPEEILLSIIIIFLAYMMSFVFKMSVSLISFWLTDIGGFFQLVEASLFIFAGYILPIELLPGILSKIAQSLPFAYMVYYPVVALQGKLSIHEYVNVIGMQIVWIGILFLIFQLLWREGIRKFVGVSR